MALCTIYLSHSVAEAGSMRSLTSSLSTYCNPLHSRVELHVLVVALRPNEPPRAARPDLVIVPTAL